MFQDLEWEESWASHGPGPRGVVHGAEEEAASAPLWESQSSTFSRSNASFAFVLLHLFILSHCPPQPSLCSPFECPNSTVYSWVPVFPSLRTNKKSNPVSHAVVRLSPDSVAPTPCFQLCPTPLFPDSSTLILIIVSIFGAGAGDSWLLCKIIQCSIFKNYKLMLCGIIIAS